MSDPYDRLLLVSITTEGKKLRTQLLTDDELARAFAQTLGKRRYEATFVEYDQQYPRYEGEIVKTFTADSKPEALRIAREYGARFLNKKVAYVYLAPRG